ALSSRAARAWRAFATASLRPRVERAAPCFASVFACASATALMRSRARGALRVVRVVRLVRAMESSFRWGWRFVTAHTLRGRFRAILLKCIGYDSPQNRRHARERAAMTYFVTGGTGFIGRFLIDKLV